MKIRDIVIIVVLTLIIAIALTTTLHEYPEIENMYLGCSRDADFEELQQSDSFSFKSNDPGIYLIIKVKNLSTNDEIKIEWERVDNNGSEIIQKNNLNPEGDGSGKIVVLFVKRSDSYVTGDYIVKVYLNGEVKISKKFFIADV
jgi:hypothetical protein